MAEEKQNMKIATDWCPMGNRATLTEEQKRRKKKTGSYYRRDEQVGGYKFSKGKFV